MMTMKRQALVWVDHHEARIIHPRPSSTEFDASVVAGDHGQTHERKHGGGHRHALSASFADRVAEAVREYGDLALLGPGNAKEELLVHLRERHREIAQRVAVTEPFERATDAQLAAQARIVFERVDRMRGIHVP